MTTAARPTFEPARGGSGKGERDLSAMSKQYSSRDLPAHTKLKYREHGQTTSDELRGRDFRRELDDRERAVGERKRGGEGVGRRGEAKRPRIDAPPTNLDADDALDSDSDSGDDSDDNDTLLAELELIRNERKEEEATAAKAQHQTQERIRMENIVSGNPLLNLTAKTDMKVRRRWDEDVVFKNCAAAEPDKRYYVNDSLRSEFHKRFMEKYVK